MNRTNGQPSETRIARRRAGFAALAALLLSGLLARAAPAEDKFTLAILPDVQLETSDTRLHDRLQWLVEQRAALNLKMVLQCYHDNAANPVRLLEIDTRSGTLTTRVFCPSINQDKHDSSARTIAGVQWVQRTTTHAAVR